MTVKCKKCGTEGLSENFSARRNKNGFGICLHPSRLILAAGYLGAIIE